ncbi:MAG: NAD(P)-dependent oxidoreductase [Nocardioides sp.]
MTRVAVVGATGFIGSAVAESLCARGAGVLPVTAPRLTCSARSVAELHEAREGLGALTTEMRGRLDGCDAVVNAAGMAAPGSPLDPSLVGADALLPLLLHAARPPGSRLVHVSTAAVQGPRPVLDESPDHSPFSAYSWAKALAEEALRGAHGVVVYRPTSVHGRGRDVTRALARVVASPLASVAGTGDAPTPQALVSNVADALAFVTLSEAPPPPVVLHPWEGLTVAELVRRLGGREPRHLPVPLARSVAGAGRGIGRHWSRAVSWSRRLEMMWFGQRQDDGWLRDRWEPPVGLEAWEALR